MAWNGSRRNSSVAFVAGVALAAQGLVGLSLAEGAVASAPAALSRADTVAPRSAQLNLQESFDDSTLVDPSSWLRVVGTGSAGSVCLTARNSTPPAITMANGTTISGCSATPDPDGSGALRLTIASGTQAGAMLYDDSLSTAEGLDITFRFSQWGGTGTPADGLSFFVKDGANNVNSAGASGPGLGYSYSGGKPGVPGALFGIGLDLYGNFSLGDGADPFNASKDCGASAGPGFSANSLVLRGDDSSVAQDGSSGFCYLAGKTVNIGPSGNVFNTSRAQGERRVRIVVDKPTVPNPRVYVYMSQSSAGVLPTSPTLEAPLPAKFASTSNFKFGFAASTGGGYNNHDIWDLGIQAAALQLVSVAAAFGPVQGGNTVTLTAAGDIFQPGTTVTLAGVPCTNVVIQANPRILTCTAGAAASGVGNVVATSGGVTASLTDAYTYQATVPSAPLLTVTPGDQSASVAWVVDDTGGSALTRLEFAFDDTTTFDDSTTVIASPTQLSGLTNGQQYVLYVRAVNSIGEGPWSLASTFTPSVPPPPPPTPLPPTQPLSVSAVAGDGSAVVTWSPPAQSGSFAVSTYKVVSEPDGKTCLVTAPTLTCTVTGLTNGTTYSFTVTALSGAGWSPVSSPSNQVTPKAEPPTPVISLVLDRGTRSADGRHDRIRTTGSSTGIPEGTLLTPYIRYGGQKEFTQGLATIVVQADGTFRWTREIRSNRRVTGYVAWAPINSNKVTWIRVR